ncbi:hypothetical protein BC829DRAFT_59147 [Chytridium lagenaria]|nr:hypothetical protein BC829DRAFT_59147 [Chytridium lagenaria]
MRIFTSTEEKTSIVRRSKVGAMEKRLKLVEMVLDKIAPTALASMENLPLLVPQSFRCIILKVKLEALTMPSSPQFSSIMMPPDKTFPVESQSLQNKQVMMVKQAEVRGSSSNQHQNHQQTQQQPTVDDSRRPSIRPTTEDSFSLMRCHHSSFTLEALVL